MVIAIIGILIALLLPAVQAAREAARRMECTNKMKQIALSLQNYHDVYRAFPLGGAPDKNAPSGHVSFLTCILPFIEQGALYDSLIAANVAEYGVATPPAVYYNRSIIKNKLVYAKPVPAFWCPSDAMANWDGDRGYFAPCNYVGNYGDSCPNMNSDNFYRNPEDIANNRGMFIALNVDPTWMGMEAVLDGTSNTVFVSEKTIALTMGSDTEYTDGTELRRTFALANGNGGNCKSACMGRSIGAGQIGGRTKGIDSVTGYNCYKCGHSWAYGALNATGFQTILPPNAPSCDGGGGSFQSNPLVTAQSYHSGGCNVAMVDASVRFVSSTIDCGSLSAYPARSGASNSGVWGAMGSRAGGESVSQ